MLEALKNTASNVAFFFLHETTPEIASHARSVFLAEKGFVEMMLQLGLVTEDRIGEIEQDEDLQDMYFSIMKRARDGGRAAREAAREIDMLPDDLHAGWYEYRRKFYERRWNLKLISPEE